MKGKPFYQRRRWKVWGAGIAQGMIHGAATALGSVVFIGTANAVGVAVPTLSLRTIAAVFVAGSISGGAAYLRQSPWPRPEDDTQPTMLTKSER